MQRDLEHCLEAILPGARIALYCLVLPCIAMQWPCSMKKEIKCHTRHSYLPDFHSTLRGSGHGRGPPAELPVVARVWPS